MQFQPDYSLFSEITGFLQDGGFRLRHHRASSSRVLSNVKRISIALNHLTGVVAGLVPATPNVEAQSKNNRGGRDKPGHDQGERAKCFNLTESVLNQETHHETRCHTASSAFRCENHGVDLGRPIGEATQRAIERAMDEYAVCVLPGQHLEDEEQIAFSRLYGPLEVSTDIGRKSRAAGRSRRIAYKEIFDISNLDENGGIRGEQDARLSLQQVTQLWHTDLAFQRGSAKWSMLHAKVIPPAGGDTEYADTRAAYDALPDAMKRRLEGLIAEHSLWHSTAKRGGYVPTEDERRSYPPARHKLVRRHPGSGRNALYIASYASHIVGMPVADGQALLTELIEFATQPQFVYRHKWQAGDLVIWDNRCTMHRATPFAATDHVRDMRRTTIMDRAPDVLVG